MLRYAARTLSPLSPASTVGFNSIEHRVQGIQGQASLELSSMPKRPTLNQRIRQGHIQKSGQTVAYCRIL